MFEKVCRHDNTCIRWWHTDILENCYSTTGFFIRSCHACGNAFVIIGCSQKDTNTVIVPRAMPPNTSLTKCCARYTREYATKNGIRGSSHPQSLFLKMGVSSNAVANAVAVWPDGKLLK